jgi:hypothetical protein
MHFFFGLPIEILRFWGILKYLSKNLKIAVVKPKKQICSRLVTANQGGQKNRNGRTTAVLFYHVFY